MEKFDHSSDISTQYKVLLRHKTGKQLHFNCGVNLIGNAQKYKLLNSLQNVNDSNPLYTAFSMSAEIIDLSCLKM